MQSVFRYVDTILLWNWLQMGVRNSKIVWPEITEVSWPRQPWSNFGLHNTHDFPVVRFFIVTWEGAPSELQLISVHAQHQQSKVELGFVGFVTSFHQATLSKLPFSSITQHTLNLCCICNGIYRQTLVQSLQVAQIK